MATYNTKTYAREAIKLAVPVTGPSIPDFVILGGGESVPLYRDTAGLYVLPLTEEGLVKTVEGDWTVLIEPTVPAVPQVDAVPATGSFEVTGVATGDGVVGFEINGTPFVVTPTPGATAEITAAVLAAAVVGLSGVASGAVITITDGLLLVGDTPVVDISTDSTQGGTNIVDLSGAVDFVAEIPEKPPVFEVYKTDEAFNAVYELAP